MLMTPTSCQARAKTVMDVDDALRRGITFSQDKELGDLLFRHQGKSLRRQLIWPRNLGTCRHHLPCLAVFNTGSMAADIAIGDDTGQRAHPIDDPDTAQPTGR